MAGVLDEFDDATPLKKTFCSKLTVEEFEAQSASYTEDALAQLISHLESNPEEYKRVLNARKKEEEEEAGFFSFIKVKLFSFLSGDEGYNVSDSECTERLDRLKDNMIKSYNDSQESKGRRFSKRLLEKRARKQLETTPYRGQENIPLPPPLPSVPFNPATSKTPKPVPSYCVTPIVHATLTRRPLTSRQVKQAGKKKESGNVKDLMRQLKGSECRKRLKRVAERSPGGTPVEGWPKRHRDPDLLPYFNAKLLKKFKNVQSPIPSPTFVMASPGSFESPILTSPPPLMAKLSPDDEVESDKVDAHLTRGKSSKEAVLENTNTLNEEPMEVQC